MAPTCFRALLPPAFAALALLAGAAAVSSAIGATYTWNGNSTTSNGWSDSANWFGGSIPISDTASVVSFTSPGSQSAASPNSLQNLTTPSPYALSGLSFDFTGASGAFSLGGSDLALAGATSLAQNSAYNVTVSNSFSLGGTAPNLPLGLTVAGNGTGTLTLSGTINLGSSQLIKNGASSLALSGAGSYYAASYTGGITTQTAGTQTINRSLEVANSSATGTASYNLSGGTLSAQMVNVGVSGAGASVLNQNGGQVSSFGQLNVGTNGTYNLSVGVLNLSGGNLNVSGNGKVNQTGGSAISSAMTLSTGGIYNLSGGTFNPNGATIGSNGAGTLNITGTGSSVNVQASGLTVGAAGVVTVSGGGTLSMNNLTATASTASIALSDPSGGVSAMTVTQGFTTFAGVISDSTTGRGGLTLAGMAVSPFGYTALTLSGVNTYSGPTRVTSGRLALASTGTIANSSVISISSGAVLDVSAKTGTGFVVSSGQTLNNNGTVTGSLDVRGGTLSGAGSVSGAVLVESASAISPGNSPGAMSTGNLTLSSGSTTILELATTTAGTGYDQINVTGTVMLGNGTLNVFQTLPVGLAAGTNFFVLTNDGTDAVVGTFLGLAQDGVLLANSVPFRISYTGDSASGVFEGAGNDVVLQNISAVPEPSAWTLTLMTLLGGAGLVTMARARRMQRVRRTAGELVSIGGLGTSLIG